MTRLKLMIALFILLFSISISGCTNNPDNLSIKISDSEYNNQACQDLATSFDSLVKNSTVKALDSYTLVGEYQKSLFKTSLLGYARPNQTEYLRFGSRLVNKSLSNGKYGAWWYLTFKGINEERKFLYHISYEALGLSPPNSTYPIDDPRRAETRQNTIDEYTIGQYYQFLLMFQYRVGNTVAVRITNIEKVNCA
ncbi:MAG TPA: hypothetical protein VJI75_02650 [Candidatus Nanoarchaeia archaeon]|nr:hypothetical protein [Candidatus Nanoarchaeia archaeon]